MEGIYTEQDLAGPYVISHALNEQSGTDQFDFSVYVALRDGADPASAEAAIATISDAYPNAELQSRAEYIDAQAAQIDMIVNLMYGLLGLAVIIALISIANSMALSIHERTRELGLLRAVGMTRRQTKASVAWEAVLIALVGTVLGVVDRHLLRLVDQRHDPGGRSRDVHPAGPTARRDRAHRRDRCRDRRLPPGVAGGTARRVAGDRHGVTTEAPVPGGAGGGRTGRARSGW